MNNKMFLESEEDASCSGAAPESQHHVHGDDGRQEEEETEVNG